MHQANPYGHLLIGGRAPTNEELARILGERDIDVTSWTNELERNKVFSRTAEQIIYSRRMVNDEKQRKKWVKRQRNHRDSIGKNGRDKESMSRESHHEVTPMSRRSSSSSSSSSSITSKAVTAGRESASNGNGEWFKTERGIDAKGIELGIPARPSETYLQYKRRLFAAMNKPA